ncbi:hypothetical protein Goari_019688 [Gossypium aridum]|uniref:RNase H type-1 domain-containing protein n=1 Tax=Gossypium aridum TaxID=34290 RepID=A0A7J8WUI6_GOSAI|nr:hypothetical protein [Gossypium aridum]
MMTARGPTRSFQDPSSCSNLNGNWVYLNTDGSLRLENDSASAGQIVRDHVGNWIFGFNRFLETYSVFDAKLWGILDGLDILID